MKKFALLALLSTSPLFEQTTVSSIDPASGPTSGGTFVHIAGTDLFGLPLACPALDCGNYVRFGETLGAISINTATEIVAITPAHAAGPVDVVVNIAGKAKITLPAAFRYEASSASEVENILLPLAALREPVAGANGSLWKVDLTFHNASQNTIVLAQTCNPLAPCPATIELPPGSTTNPPLYAVAGTVGGLFVSVPRVSVRDLDITIRVQDLSRQSQTWGTTVPVVLPTDFRPAVRLIGVPVDPRFRLTLRVYGYDAADSIRVRIFSPSIPLPLVDVGRQLQGDPPSLQIDALAAAFPQVRGMEVVRIEVASDSNPPKPLWAFISVTNNETQHVTVIAPSP